MIYLLGVVTDLLVLDMEFRKHIFPHLILIADVERLDE